MDDEEDNGGRQFATVWGGGKGNFSESWTGTLYKEESENEHHVKGAVHSSRSVSIDIQTYIGTTVHLIPMHDHTSYGPTRYTTQSISYIG